MKETPARVEELLEEQSRLFHLEPGELGLVTARAGVGKTALLVGLGFAALLKQRRVLHIAMAGQTLADVEARYQACWQEAAGAGLDLPQPRWEQLLAARLIRVSTDHTLLAETLSRNLRVLAEHMTFKPDLVLIDGLDWSDPDNDPAALKSVAQSTSTVLFCSAIQRRSGDSGSRLHASLEELSELSVSLEPTRTRVVARLVERRGDEVAASEVQMRPGGMGIMGDLEGERKMAHASHTLLSGGAAGAEAEFGGCAERWGLQEKNFSFAGRGMERTRGTVLLSDEDLQRGRVSNLYLQRLMQRDYPDNDEFRKIIMTVWHQVNTAGEVFVVGWIKRDGTVKGGTGWAAELAKQLRKRVFVFDLTERAWHTWRDRSWHTVPPPIIRAPRFTGSGTRHLDDSGRTAIRELFERSFGPAE